ncbi:MAG: 3'-5' exoribonuclease [Blastocatellia bacterium]|nr:3'-5' exoribonuclease [Chloracidobacterium sp.]MBL8185431.1 3'-5' exoribonuclease [Blastocatellia bacterium]HRJ89364.1 exonuclease domain-containing protein [Pyrinomonadaceae bacterium]HRK48841.1 exonuclease domain-containing protein [Pyrinomonadaceae bacterium]
MAPSANLISESLLIKDTISLLESLGGRAPAVRIVDRVMKIKKPEPFIARLLVQELVERDSRLAIVGDGDDVEFVGRDHGVIDLSNTSFVVFDLETTGAKAPPCRVTEIGAYRVVNGEIEGEFHTLVNPETPIPSFITSLTGISDDMVRGAPVFCDIADEFLAFIGDSVLVAHNARFDMGFLNHEIGLVYEDYCLENPSLCTVQLSRKLLPDIENHKLNTVARHYSIDLVNHHRASDDARATARIFLNLLSDLRSRGIEDLASAREFSKKRKVC